MGFGSKVLGKLCLDAKRINVNHISYKPICASREVLTRLSRINDLQRHLCTRKDDDLYEHTILSLLEEARRLVALYMPERYVHLLKISCLFVVKLMAADFDTVEAGAVEKSCRISTMYWLDLRVSIDQIKDRIKMSLC